MTDPYEFASAPLLLVSQLVEPIDHIAEETVTSAQSHGEVPVAERRERSSELGEVLGRDFDHGGPRGRSGLLRSCRGSRHVASRRSAIRGPQRRVALSM